MENCFGMAQIISIQNHLNLRSDKVEKIMNVARVRRGSISSELLMYGGGVRSIFLLLLVARCLDTILWHMFVFMF